MCARRRITESSSAMYARSRARDKGREMEGGSEGWVQEWREGQGGR
jgi:hypothetical protein